MTPGVLAMLALRLAPLAAPPMTDDAMPRVVVLTHPKSQAVSTRIAAELRATGFSPVVEPATVLQPVTDEVSERDVIEALARERGAIAVVRTRWSRTGVEVLVLEQVTGKTVLRNEVAAPGEALSDAVIALRSVELLRASFLEVRHRPAAAASVPAVVQRMVTATDPPPRLRRYALLLGPAVESSPDAAGPYLGLAALGQVQVVSNLVLRMRLSAPLAGVATEGASGSAVLQPLTGGVGIGVRRERGRLVLGGALDVQSGAVRIIGDTAPPLVAHTVTRWTFGPAAEASVGVTLSPAVALLVFARASLALPPVNVRFVSESVAVYGPFVGGGGMLLELRP